MARQKSNRPVVFPILMVVAGLALIIGSIWWTMQADSAVALIDSPAQTQGLAGGIPTPAVNRIPYPGIARVSIAEAKTAFDSSGATFIDVRGQDLFNSGHIPGALVMDVDIVNDRILAVEKSAWIIPYCT